MFLWTNWYLRYPRSLAEPVFRHGAYHPTNILWQRGVITGIVDWSSMIGPVGIDLAHCRIGFVCMYGLTGADHFLEAYRSIGHDDSRDDQLQARCDAVQCWFDAFLYQPWFDLGMQLTEKGIRDRLDAYAVNIASRLD